MKRIRNLILITLLTMILLITTVQGALTDGLVAYYSFDSTAKDDTNNGNNGTLQGNAFINTSYKACGAGSVELDGVSDYVEVPNDLFGNQSATQSMWVSTRNNALLQSISRQWTNPNYNFIIRLDAGGQIEFFGKVIDQF